MRGKSLITLLVIAGVGFSQGIHRLAAGCSPGARVVFAASSQGIRSEAAVYLPGVRIASIGSLQAIPSEAPALSGVVDSASTGSSKGLGSSPASAVPSSAREIEWLNFAWSGGSVGGKTVDRAALLVPVKLKENPKTFWMQLDTGSNVSVVYGIPFSQLNCSVQPDENDANLVRLSGALGNCAFDSLRFFMSKDFGDSLDEKEEHPLIGTIGPDFLVGKVLLIDFPKSRFYLADSLNDALRDLLSRASFVDLERRSDRLFVTVEVAGVSYREFFFDSGASLLPILTSKKLWQRFTGLKGTEKSNMRVTVPSWGEEVALVGAPVKGVLKFGKLQVRNPIAYFAPKGLMEADGLIGNSLFYDEYMVILDLKQNRFGILESE